MMMRMSNSESEKEAMERAVTDKSIALRIRRVLEKHSKLVSTIVILAVTIPSASVGAQISTTHKILPAARNFTMYDAETHDLMKLSDYLGKVVFIDFMATWCTTCKQSMPDLRQLNNTYGTNPSFVLLSVTTDLNDNDTKMIQFKRDYQGTWTFAIPFDPSWVGSVYGVQGYPTYVIMDKEGQIAYRSVGLTPLATLKSQVEIALIG